VINSSYKTENLQTIYGRYLHKKLTFVNQRFNMDKQTEKFIREHLRDDVIQLGLQSKRYPDVDIQLAIKQISGLQKVKCKIPQLYENDEILFPRQLSIEQSSSEMTAKYKAGLFSGNAFADLTGGFGIDFYFLSQHFKHGMYVECDEELCHLAKHNFNVLNIPSYEIHQTNADDFLMIMPDVDLIFIDPHRRSNSGKKAVLISDCEPDASALAKKMLDKAPTVLIKLSPMLDIHQAIKEIPETVEVHILAVENECKEVLLVLKRKDEVKILQQQENQVFIKTINFLKSGEYQQFDFIIEEENVAKPDFADSPAHFLYEPNAAIMKSGAFKTISARYKLKKLHVNTHLYTDATLQNHFPGRIFRVKEVFGNSKVDLKKLKEKYPKANVSTRNYPLSVDDFRKKTGIKDGGDDYLFALKTSSEKNIIIACDKIN
jgi:16S rRNA G966 N2-methylase RsmD